MGFRSITQITAPVSALNSVSTHCIGSVFSKRPDAVARVANRVAILNNFWKIMLCPVVELDAQFVGPLMVWLIGLLCFSQLELFLAQIVCSEIALG